MLGRNGNVSYSTYLEPIDISGTVNVDKQEKKPFKDQLPRFKKL